LKNTKEIHEINWDKEELACSEFLADDKTRGLVMKKTLRRLNTYVYHKVIHSGYRQMSPYSDLVYTRCWEIDG
jgi:hypothetical protein